MTVDGVWFLISWRVINYSVSAFHKKKKKWGSGGREKKETSPLLCPFWSADQKSSEIGFPEIYIVGTMGRQSREKAWSIRHVSGQKEGEERIWAGLGVYLKLKEF